MGKKKTTKPAAPPLLAGIPVDKGRIDLAMEAAEQIEVLSNRLLRHINNEAHDSEESATVIRALASRCKSLAGSIFTLLVEDDCVGREDIEKIEILVAHG
jgi:hypothetical protein